MGGRGLPLILATVLAWWHLPAMAIGTCDVDVESTFSHQEIGVIPLRRDRGTQALVFSSLMHVNTDGAPNSYHPDNIGITHICNGVSVGRDCTWKANCVADFNKAKAEGFRGLTHICFFAMATDSSKRPILQGENDPAPGYFVSTTALKQPGMDPKTAQGQLDSNQIPFVVIPSSWQKTATPGVKLGDFALVLRKSTGQLAAAIVGDVGPKRKLGEGSVALHEALGNDPFVMKQGVRRALRGIGGRDVLYVIFPGSRRPNEPITKAQIDSEGARLLESFGGRDRVLACAR